MNLNFELVNNRILYSGFYQYINRTNTGSYLMYIGQMTPDLKKRQGVGIRIYLTGQFEENYWIDDQAEGIGRCIFKLGSYYEGGFKHNVKHGYGDYVNYTGDRYIGYYKNDEREYEG